MLAHQPAVASRATSAFAADARRLRLPAARRPRQGGRRAYGILGPLGFYRRSIFVVDAEGVVRYAHRATAGLTFRPVDEIVAAVRSIEG